MTEPHNLNPQSSDLMEPLLRLDKDLRKAAKLLGRFEVIGLTKLYYQIQEFRKAAANQKRSAGEGEPNALVTWVFENFRRMEDDIKRTMDTFTEEYTVGRWLKSITGIGPIISAGFLAHLDVRKAKTAGHFIRFAGQEDPAKVLWEGKADCLKWIEKQEAPLNYEFVRKASEVWGRNVDTLYRFATTKSGGAAQPLTQDSLAKALARRPWNADLKRLCYIAADCFMKFQNNKNDHYGQLYVRRKQYETERNLRGDYRLLIEKSLTEKNFSKDTEAYAWYSGEWVWDPQLNPQLAAELGLTGVISEKPEEEDGTPKKFVRRKRVKDVAPEIKAKYPLKPMLPPARIHMRCLRYSTHIFLSHLHHVMYSDYYQQQPPVPYIFAKGNGDHRHFIPVPNWPFAEGGKSLRELLVD